MFIERLTRLRKQPSVWLALTVWLVWSLYMFHSDRWSLFDENAFVSITMMFASFIAGATSEGGGAVAFPVLTIFFGIEPIVARDFSLAIQSVGMSAAAFAIWVSRIQVEKRALCYASVGGLPGLIIGIYVVAPLMSPPLIKMFFVSLWLSFGIVIAYKHIYQSRNFNRKIARQDSSVNTQLVGLGLVGGCITGITGSGIDIVIFSYLVLQHRVDLRIATATAVVLMAGNALIGVNLRLFDEQAISAQVWEYWLVSIPIVVVGAPLGARFIARQSYRVVAAILAVTISAQFMGAILIVQQSIQSILLSLATFAIGFCVFSGVLHRKFRQKRKSR